MFDHLGKAAHRYTDPLEDAVQAVEALLAEDRSGWPAHAIGERVTTLLEVAERARAAAAVAMGEFDAVKGWTADGSATAVSWLAHHAPVNRGDASRVVSAARLLHHHERTRKALTSGDITGPHVDVLARGAQRRCDTFDRDEDILLDAASALSPDDLTTIVRRWAHFADDQQSRDDRDARHRQRYLHASTTFDGAVRIDALLDPEGGAVFLAALEDLSRPEPAATPPELARTAAQRRADDLVELAHRHLSRRNTDASAPVAAVDVIITADVITASAVFHPTASRCDIARIGPVHPSIAERFLCDSWVGRLVMATQNEPVDVGRRTRTFTAAQRRAIIARDERCVFPGCDRGPEWCDAHHLEPYGDGGSTAIDNAVLLCRHHHSSVHRGWTLTRNDSGGFGAVAPHTRR